MAGGMVRSRKLMGTPEWVFPWRPLKTPWFPKLVALVVPGVALTLLVATARIQVRAPVKSVQRKASVIYLRDDAQGRALTLRAQEGGPFPSRFEPSEWAGMAELEAAAMAAVRFQPRPYVAALQELPAENREAPLRLAARGESFFPRPSPPPVEVPERLPLHVAPVIYPLSGIAKDALPRELPAFEAAVDGAMSSASWRFLVRLTPGGGVAECVSLEKGGEPGAAELEAWLHRVPFAPEPGMPFRWIALGIGFTNQPVDGNITR